MLELLLASILGVLLLILLTLVALLNLWKRELNYQNRGLLACLPEINQGLSLLVGEEHLSPVSGRDGLMHDLFRQLDVIQSELSEINTTVAPLRRAELPGMPRSKYSEVP